MDRERKGRGKVECKQFGFDDDGDDDSARANLVWIGLLLDWGIMIGQRWGAARDLGKVFIKVSNPLKNSRKRSFKWLFLRGEIQNKF